MNIVVLNEKRINFDNKINMKSIGKNITLYDYTNEDEIINRCNNMDVVITKEIKMSKEIIMNLPSSVKLICEAGTGYDNIDIVSCKERNIIVENIPEYATRSVSECIISFILRLSKLNYSEDIQGKTLGVIGTGKIGEETIKLSRNLNMNILAYSRHENIKNIKYVSLEELLSKSDYISINLPLTNETYHLLNKEKLSLIKKGACLINTSRGKVIDEKELVNLLDKNILKAVALDVLEEEPLTKENPLNNRNNVILTPHISWASIESRNKLIKGLKENIDSFENNIIVNKVN